MSGIVGIINLDGAPVDRDLLKRMTDSMSFRGPDAQEIWIDGNVGFGHAMLRTTFEAETEKQPLTLDGKVWLSADARIDGRKDLIIELEAKLRTKLQIPHGSNGNGPQWRVPNDAELILFAYQAWGEDCVKHLIGDFAFAIWDGRERKLFCARDHVGIKQLYYAAISDCFIFSNTLNSIRVHPRVSENLNEVAVGDFLLFGQNEDLSTTIFSDIRRVPAGNLLTLSSSMAIRRYWEPSPDREIKFQRRAEYVEHFQDLLAQAVDDRLRTNRVGVSMSGGLDSTSVAAVALDLWRQRGESHELEAYAVVYDRLIPDQERHYSTVAATALGIPITHLVADDFALYEERAPNDLNVPEPYQLDPYSAHSNSLLRLHASCSRVGLTGWDGDAFMNEPPCSHFAVLAKGLRLNQLVADLGWFVLSRHQLPPIGIRTALKRLVGKDRFKTFYPEWLDRSFAKKIDLPSRWRRINSKPPSAHPSRPYAFRVLNSAAWSVLFESYDAGITRLPLEMRHPLIDVRLVEYLVALPPVPWCVNKEILRVAMARKLPQSVLKRPKSPLAGDPAIRIASETSVRYLDEFEPLSKLESYVNVSACPQLAGERNPDRLWTNLRPFAFNHWLAHSLSTEYKLEQKNETQPQYT
jgi:asparagine synthase (glutamine-hydrolysing)